MKPASPYAVVEQLAFSYPQFPLLTKYPYLSRGREGSERGKTHLDPRESGFRVSPLVYPSVGMGLYRGQWTLAKAPPSRITVFAHALLPVPRRLSPHSYRLGLGRFPRSLSTQLRRPFRAVYLSPVGGFGWVLSPTCKLNELRFQLPEKHKGRLSGFPLVETLTDALPRTLVKAEDTRLSGLTYVAFDDNADSVAQKKGPTQEAGPQLDSTRRRTSQ